MTGNDNTVALQHTRQDTDILDRIGQFVLRQRGGEFREGKFTEIINNDERVLNGPGVNVPCLSISRFPYPEYHTTEDNLSIIHEEKLQEAADVIEEIIRIHASNYTPKGTFRGPLFLSGNGLWVDWRENWDLNRAIEKIMMRLEGEHTVFDIAEQVELDYWMVREYVEKFRAKGFMTPQPIPFAGQTQ
jgi:aminopeptidase-like protein